MHARLHHVQLAMPRGEEAAARAFYVDVLGLAELAVPTTLTGRDGLRFGTGEVLVHLAVEDPFAPSGRCHPAIEVDEVAAVADRLDAAGHPVVWDGSQPGTRRCYVSDTFGNRLEFLTHDPTERGDVRS